MGAPTSATIEQDEYGEYTITPYAVLPTITEAVTIDGSTQPGTGAAGHPHPAPRPPTDFSKNTILECMGHIGNIKIKPK